MLRKTPKHLIDGIENAFLSILKGIDEGLTGFIFLPIMGYD
jgi:hypothetical protein